MERFRTKIRRLCPRHKEPLQRKGGRWRCPVKKCDVFCGDGPTSTPCDQETAELRNEVHAVFDPLWKSGRFVSAPVDGAPEKNYRTQGYKWLAFKLGIGRDACHIGRFDAALCRKALTVLSQLAATEHAATNKD